MEKLFLNKEHLDRFLEMGIELNQDFTDPYWRSVLFIIAGNDTFYRSRKQLIDYEEKSINSWLWFSSVFSGGETRMLALAYNLFTGQGYYEFEDGRHYYISPMEIFSGVDETMFMLAKNAIDVRVYWEG